jgi:hypothetical protein
VRSTKLPSWIKSLFGFEPLPRPPHVFALSSERLRYGQIVRERQGFRFRGAVAANLPPDAFLSGPLGGPLRDPAAFRALLAELVKSVPGGVKEASLVLPDAWLRVSFTESGDLPSGLEALDEVLRFKLRRMVPFRIDELRVSAAEVEPLPGQAEPRRLLLGFAVEQLLSQLEEAFAAAGIRLGQIGNESLSMLDALPDDGEGDGFTALTAVDENGYSLVFSRGGEPILHRFKGKTPGSAVESSLSGQVERDLKLTRNFLTEHYPEAYLSRVLLAAPRELESLWLERLEAGLGAAAEPLDGRVLPLALGTGESAPPWRELAPMLGAVRRRIA